MCISSSCSQTKLRLEMEMERQRQSHSKEIESRDEEVEEIRRSCSKKVGVAHFPSLSINSSFPKPLLSRLTIRHIQGKSEKQFFFLCRNQHISELLVLNSVLK